MPTTDIRKDGELLLERVPVARGFWSRAVGLIGAAGGGTRPRALFLPACRSMHTCFMRFPLDLFFLSAEDVVVRVRRAVPPFRMVAGGTDAAAVLEVEAGRLAAAALREGDRLTLSGP